MDLKETLFEAEQTTEKKKNKTKQKNAIYINAMSNIEFTLWSRQVPFS